MDDLGNLIAMRPWLAHDGNGSADADHNGRPIELGKWYIEGEYQMGYKIIGGPYITEPRPIVIDSHKVYWAHP